jgi:hypothetical protein
VSILYVGAEIPEDASPIVREGIVRRRMALLNGLCVCGATVELPSRRERRAGVTVLHIFHAEGCAAASPELDEYLRGAP